MGKFPIATPHWVPWGQIQSLAQRWEQRLQRMKDGTFQGWKESGDFYGDLGKQKHVIYCEIIRKWHAWVLQGGRVEVAPFLGEDLWALQGCTRCHCPTNCVWRTWYGTSRRGHSAEARGPDCRCHHPNSEYDRFCCCSTFSRAGSSNCLESIIDLRF